MGANTINPAGIAPQANAATRPGEDRVTGSQPRDQRWSQSFDADARRAAAPSTAGPVAPVPRAAGSDPFLQINRIEQQLVQVTRDSDRLTADLVGGKLKPGSPEHLARQNHLMQEFFGLQMAAQKASLGAELLSKAVEHSTSSTKQILQTQA